MKSDKPSSREDSLLARWRDSSWCLTPATLDRSWDPMRSLLNGPIGRESLDSFDEVSSEAFADSIVQKMQPATRDTAYWNQLFVFASSRQMKLRLPVIRDRLSPSP